MKFFLFLVDYYTVVLLQRSADTEKYAKVMGMRFFLLVISIVFLISFKILNKIPCAFLTDLFPVKKDPIIAFT